MNPEKNNRQPKKVNIDLSSSVHSCLSNSKPKQARQAERQLLDTSSLNFNTTIEAVSLLQTYWANTNNPISIKKALALVDRILTGSVIYPPEINRSLEITPHTCTISQKLIETDRKLQANRFIQSVLPPTYHRLIREIIPEIQQRKHEGLNSFILPLTIVEWDSKIKSLLPESINEQTPCQQDNLVNLIKTPIRPSFFQYSRLFDQPFAGTSLANIEQMSYPLSQSNVCRINDLFIDVCSQGSNPWEQRIFMELFQQQVYFSNTAEGKISYQNKALLANLNNWQEKFIENLLFPEDEIIETQIQKLLQCAPEHFTQFLPLTMALWTCNSPEMDPDFSRQDFWGDYRDIIQTHSLTKTATAKYLAQNPAHALSADYIDKLGRTHILDNLLPLLEKRLIQFGALEKCQEGILVVRGELNDPVDSRFLFQH
ncbi:MAG: hypothetical protein Q7R97_03440 [Candidatus Daviesbacteria bacterium]|nr:hypothetical protein [Candidatus Daviesbacteria bacterium]